MVELIVLVAVWVGCGVLAYGFTLGKFTEEFPWSRHAGFAAGIGCFGPFGLLVVLILSEGVRKLRFKPLTTEQRWQAHKEKWPLLDYSYFKGTD